MDFTAVHVVKPNDVKDYLQKNPRVKIVLTRWVDSDKSEVGEEEQLKSRRVVRGDLEYHPYKLRTDSPTCSQLIVNMILAHAASMNLRVRRSTAPWFSHCHLEVF